MQQSPFPPLRLAPPDRQRLRRLADELLRSALREYEHRGAPARRQLPKSHWKPLKSRENCIVYKPVDASSSNRTGRLPSSFSSDDSSDLDDIDVLDETPHAPELRYAPELVLAGSVPGALDDVLFGASACDSADVLLRSAFVDASLVDGAVLAQLQMPTVKQPFRFLGVKWAVREIRSQYKKPSPRDFVYLEAVGVVPRRDGSRLGYLLRYPLELAACGELAFDRDIVRGSMAVSAIFTPLANNSVDIFALGKQNLGGSEKLGGATAQSACASALLSLANAVLCAHNMKLVWLLREQQRNGGANPAVPVVRSNMFACGMCSKKFGKLSSVGTCRVCCVQMCSRCRLTRTLNAVDVDKGLRIESVGGVFCKNCIAHANHANAAQVASDEVRAGRYGPAAPDDDSDSQSDRSSRSNGSLLESHQQQHQQTRSAAPSQAPVSQSVLYNESPNHQQAPRSLAQLPPRNAAASSAPRAHKSDGFSMFSAPVSFDSNRSTDMSRDSTASSFCSADECEPLEGEVSGDAIGAREFHGWTFSAAATNSSSRNEAANTSAATSAQYQPSYAPPPPPPQQQQTYAMDSNQQRQELWRKMTELRLQAESVYQLTKQNSLHMNGSSVTEVCYDSDVDELD